VQVPVVAWTTLGISAIFGLVVWRVRAGTAGAAATGAAITASLMYATTRYPYRYSWLHGGLLPLLAVFLLTFAATRVGKAKKERLGTGESKRGRNAAQVAANLGVSTLVSLPVVALTSGMMSRNGGQSVAYMAAIAALAEAAADTVSSEIGQVLGGQPRMLTTFRRVEAGTDGGVTLIGTAAGVAAAFLVAAVGTWAIRSGGDPDANWLLCCMMGAGGVFGLLFDSLLGATMERRGWLNNDAVNFLSTLAAALFTIAEVAVLTYLTRV
jgi:uncharacterized protein (TIGR00297 family)